MIAKVLIDVRDIRELWKEAQLKIQNIFRRCRFWLDPESTCYQSNKIKEIKKMVLFCALGWRSALATKSLVDMGFTNVAHDGFDALKKERFKVIAKKKINCYLLL